MSDPNPRTSSAQRAKFSNAERVIQDIQIEYGTSQKQQKIPYVFAVLSDLHGTATSERHRNHRELVKQGKVKGKDGKPEKLFKLHEVCQRDDFLDLFDQFKPEFCKALENHLNPADPPLAVNFCDHDDENGEKRRYGFHSMADFGPEKIAERVPAIVEWQRAREAIERFRDKVGRKDHILELLESMQTDPNVKQKADDLARAIRESK